MSIDSWDDLDYKLTIQATNIENFIVRCSKIELPIVHSYDHKGCISFVWHNYGFLERPYLDVSFHRNGKYSWYFALDGALPKSIDVDILPEEVFDILNKYFNKV
jgi:hypothetical protein